jgi:hypothetical protein
MKKNKKAIKAIKAWRERQRAILDDVQKQTDAADKLPMKELVERLKRRKPN